MMAPHPSVPGFAGDREDQDRSTLSANGRAVGLSPIRGERPSMKTYKNKDQMIARVRRRKRGASKRIKTINLPGTKFLKSAKP